MKIDVEMNGMDGHICHQCYVFYCRIREQCYVACRRDEE